VIPSGKLLGSAQGKDFWVLVSLWHSPTEASWEEDGGRGLAGPSGNLGGTAGASIQQGTNVHKRT
jgi:hypothetical protein